MSGQKVPLDSFLTFGDLLKYLRRREHLTQLELSIAVGYSDAQITRLEKNQRRPEIAALKALFIPALHIEEEPEVIARFLELAESARQEEAPVQGIPPYKGLLFFDESDSDLFFGREKLTSHLTDRVENLAEKPASHFLSVVGASGSGKSSLVRAGLAVELKRRDWQVVIFTPGTDPINALDLHLGLIETASNPNLLIVDQFEEIFTLCHSEAERILFIDRLVNISWQPEGRSLILIALRADFYSHCAQYPILRQVVAAEQEYIGQMTREELRRAIEEPARCGGWDFEPGVVDLLLNDIGAQGTGEPEPGALPLLSHALLATWERRRGRTLTLDGYRGSGGVQGAIAETAENVYNDQLNQTQQDLARDVFLRLTELGEGTEDTRRRAALNELVRRSAEATQLRLVLNTLAEARLITLNEDSAEVAHEALIREWQRLHEWLTQDRDGLLLHRHLTDSAHEWERRGKDPADLYRGARLAQAREWSNANTERLNLLEQSFLTASVEQVEHEAIEREEQRLRQLESAQKLAQAEKARAEEQASAAKRYRRRGILLAGALALVGVAAILAGVFANNLQQQALISSVRELSNTANLNLEVDPERSILLALQAVDKTYSRNHTVLPEAEDALRSAVQASHLELILRGHTDNIWSAVFSPDGKKIATASADGTAKIWDADTGAELLSIRGSTVGTVWSAVFTPNGKYLVTAGQDDLIHIWDAATGKPVSTLKGHRDEVYQARFNSDGSRLVTISTDRTGIIWDMANGKILERLGPEVDGIPQWAAISPDNSRVAIAYATSTTDGWVTIWDTTTGKKILRLPNQHAIVRSVSYSPDGTHLITSSVDQAVRIWDASDGKLQHEFYNQSGKIANAEYSPDGTQIATALGTNQVVVWEAVTGRILITLAGHTGNVNVVAFNPGGTRLVTAGKDHTARVWSLLPGHELLTLQNGPTIASTVGSKLAYSPDGKFLAVAYSDPTAKVWEVATGRLIHTLSGHTAPVNYITYSADGKRIATTADDGTAKIWQAASGKELLKLPVANSGDWVFGAAFSPDGKRLGTAAVNNAAEIWDAETGKYLFRLPGVTDWVASIAFSPDGSKIATSSFDATASLWDAATGKQLFHFTGFTDTVRQVAFSPDGKRLAASSLDGNVKVWDAATGKELFSLTGHVGPVYSVAFSTDGRYLVTASGDKTARLWDASTGKEILLVRAPDELTGVAISPDDSQLAVASRDGTARIYLLTIEDLVALAKTRVTRTLSTEECQQYLHVTVCHAQ